MSVYIDSMIAVSYWEYHLYANYLKLPIAYCVLLLGLAIAGKGKGYIEIDISYFEFSSHTISIISSYLDCQFVNALSSLQYAIYSVSLDIYTTSTRGIRCQL